MNVVEQPREMTTINFPKVNTELWRYRDEPGRLIPLLQSAQETYGYISETTIKYISGVTRIPESEIYSVITFYKQFRLRPSVNILSVSVTALPATLIMQRY